MIKNKLSFDDVVHEFDDYLNDNYPLIELLRFNYTPAYVLYFVDNKEYWHQFKTWASYQGYQAEIIKAKN